MPDPTVGPVPTANLGITLTHEHVPIDLVRVAYTRRPTCTVTHVDDPVSLDNLWCIRRDYFEQGQPRLTRPRRPWSNC
jgi:predicted metal-dependent phosphotriesterase family hydrolase